MQASKWTRRTVLTVGLLSAMGWSTGCSSNELETGYKFQRLGSSTASQRRAYYAGPFSPEAREAQLSGDTDAATNMRRPRPGM